MRLNTGRLLAAGFMLCAVCSAQLVSVVPRKGPAHPEELPRSTFRLEVKLIEIPVSVKDLQDRPILGLPQSGFRLFEDGAEQQIVAFSRSDAPISTGLVFDTSGSMRHRIQDSRAAVEQFLTTSVKGDEFSLVTFSDSPELASPFTPDAGDISRRLTGIHPRGWTAMNDAIRLSIQEMRRASNPRRVLLVLSDGGDNNSRLFGRRAALAGAGIRRAGVRYRAPRTPQVSGEAGRRDRRQRDLGAQTERSARSHGTAQRRDPQRILHRLLFGPSAERRALSQGEGRGQAAGFEAVAGLVAARLHGALKSAAYRPDEPKPPAPRSESASSPSTHSTAS